MTTKTTVKTTKTKTEILEALTVERELTDIEFLEAIIDDLDRGWITGTMCDDTGKCLVGAGAAALGLDYATYFAAINVIDYESDLDFEREFDSKVMAKEYNAASRLLSLVGNGMGMTDDYIAQRYGNVANLNSGTIVALVTSYNDGIDNYTTIRKVLTDKIEELRK